MPTPTHEHTPGGSASHFFVWSSVHLSSVQYDNYHSAITLNVTSCPGKNVTRSPAVARVGPTVLVVTDL